MTDHDKAYVKHGLITIAIIGVTMFACMITMSLLIHTYWASTLGELVAIPLILLALWAHWRIRTHSHRRTP